jgi:hypothetical protein
VVASHARKTTTKQVANEDAALDAGLKITVDGTVYVIRLGDLPGTLVGEFRRQVGMSVRAAFELCANDPDLDVLAGMVWLGRRQAGEAVSYAEVASAITYGSALDVEEPAAEEPEGEAPGGP